MNNKITVGLSVAIASLILLSSSVIADPGGNGKGHQNGNSQKQQGHKEKGDKGNKGNKGNSNKVNGHSDGSPTSITISVDQARGLAVTYGLTGYQSLPPGIAKNLARGKPLPPGIAKKMVPANMLGGLPHYPGYDWYMVGNDLVLVAATTLVVNAILESVFN
ncbi:anti-virulence regulator CigR family protein [Budvicia diplopodorum]|uniref:anti-virulence regulator CigR family protein n=1 Tax=Budvicia diplopodorum TaxID=1119056 RepID=UPI0013593E47|nr:anti-virulence regulator CigR family protein [Budvicia diplopodorum]